MARLRGTRFSTKVTDLSPERQAEIERETQKQSEIEKAAEIVRRFEALQPQEQAKILKNSRSYAEVQSAYNFLAGTQHPTVLKNKPKVREGL